MEENANKIIDDIGGTVEVARLCDVKPPSVSQWRTNGIPKARLMYLRLLRPDVFEKSERPPCIGKAEMRRSRA